MLDIVYSDVSPGHGYAIGRVFVFMQGRCNSYPRILYIYIEKSIDSGFQ